MRVLHVISGLDPENGGPTTALIGLAEAQKAAGLDVAVMATWQRTSGFPNAERMKAHGIEVRLVGQAYGKLSRHPELRQAVDEEVARADIVHVHALWEEIQHQAPRAARRRGVPYVITPHGMLSEWSFKTNRLAKRLYFAWRVRSNLRHAAAIHYIAQAERELAARHGLRAPTIVEPCGLDLSEFNTLPPAGTFRQKFPQAADRPLILFLGRLSPQKGLDLLIPAFARFRGNDASEAMLVLAGPDYDGYEATVRRWVAEYHLGERVVFTGLLGHADRLAALRDAQLLALPSHHENFGIVVAEAMAAGLPVLISNEVNIWREIESAGAGSVVAPTVDAVSNGLTHWISDPAARALAGAKGRALAVGQYDWQQIARRWVDHYQQLKRG